ncbi:MAG: hypothetical protein RLY78_70 [Pseudomonadota bacterium]|jgi:hypothetical protein
MTFHARLLLPQPGTPLMVFHIRLDGMEGHLGLVQGRLVGGRPEVSELGRQCMLRLRALGLRSHPLSQMVAVAVDNHGRLADLLRRSAGLLEAGDTLLLLCPDAAAYSRALRELQGAPSARRAAMPTGSRVLSPGAPPPVLHEVWSGPADDVRPLATDGVAEPRPFMTLAFA